MMPTIRLYLFGNLDVRCDGHPLDKPPTLKSQSLLAYLVYYRHQPQPRERLVGLFWGDRPERKARSSLSTSLWHIRRCLPDENILLATSHTVQFAPQTDLWLDTQAFERYARRDDCTSLQNAVDLYRGDFLDGFYDDWIVDERYRLEVLFADTLARLMVGREANGEYRSALTTAMRLLAHNPLREDAHRMVMQAYCQLGQRALALEQYRNCRQTLQQELAAEPTAKTVELYQAILRGQIETKQIPAPPLVQPRATSVGRNPLEVTATHPLVGREKELSFLHQCWHRVEAESVKFVLVRGGTGVGKTRLLEEFASQVRWRGMRVLWGRCYEFERVLPYQPITEAVRTSLPSLLSGILKDLPAWSISETARLVPEIADCFPDFAPPAQIEPDQEQTRLFNGVARFFAGLSSHGPLVLVFEDLHWAGESTLQLIHYLVHYLRDYPVLMIGTLRPEQLGPGHPLIALQQQLHYDGYCQPLPLSPLTADAVTALIQEMSGSGKAVLPLAKRLYLDTEGNPFFLMEIVKALFEAKVLRFENGIWEGDFSHISRKELPLPASVSEAIQAQAHRLGDEAQETLRLAAVLGQAFDFELLKAVWEQDEESTLDVLDSLLRHRLIDEGSDAQDRDYVFSHRKIQEAIYASIPRQRRQHMHGLAGAAMEQAYEPHLVLPELAFHFEQAQAIDGTMREKAITYLRSAGEQAMAQYANAEAVNYLSRALNLTPQDDMAARFELLMARERVNHLRCERAAQAKDLAAMEELADHLGNDQRITTALRQGDHYLSIGEYPTARRHLEKVLDWARAVGDQHREATSLGLLGTLYLVLGDFAAAQEHIKQALAIHRVMGDPLEESGDLRALGSAYFLASDYPAANDCYEQALELARHIQDPQMEGFNLMSLGRLSRRLDDLERAQEYTLQALAILRAIGHREKEAHCLHELGNIHHDLGQSLLAREAIEQASTLFSSVENPRSESYAQVDLGFVYHSLGDDERALAHCEQGRDGLRSVGDRWGEGGSLNYIGQALEGLGKWNAAAEAYGQALTIKRDIGQNAWSVEDLAGLARSALARGSVSEALRHIDEALIWITQHGIVGLELPLLVYLTAYRVLNAAGRTEQAETLLVEAHTILMEQASRIKGKKLRRSFLENVQVHRDIEAAMSTRSE